MPETLREVVDILDLETIEDGLYRGSQPSTGLQRVFGGQVAGQALAAADRTVPTDRVVHSLHAYFLLPGDPAEPLVYDVERTRDGHSFSVRRVVARQHGRVIFSMSSSFQVREEGYEHQDVMPEVTGPEECPTLGAVLERVSGRPSIDWAREWAALDVRYAGDSRPGGGLVDPVHPARARVWMRTADPMPSRGPVGDEQLHRCVLAYASDLTLLGASLVPHGTYLGDPRLRSASLDHAIWFHRPPKVDAWMLYDQVSSSASGGRGLVTGRLFALDGTLVASVAQEGLIRPLPG